MTIWESKLVVKQSYDVTSKIYNRLYADEQKAKYQKTLGIIDVEGKILLDAGCGSGLFFEQAAPRAQEIVGVDISRKLLNLAKKQAKRFENISIVQADVDYLPFKKETFDRAFAFTLLQNTPEPARTIEELWKTLDSTGQLIVTGLKKAFPLGKFMDILEQSKLQIATFLEDDYINCYISVLSKKPRTLNR